jgi:hypothetical protein
MGWILCRIDGWQSSRNCLQINWGSTVRALRRIRDPARSLATHADGDVALRQESHELLAREPAALVGVEDVWRTIVCHRVLDGYQVEVGGQCPILHRLFRLTILNRGDPSSAGIVLQTSSKLLVSL